MSFLNYTSRPWTFNIKKESTFGTISAITAGTTGWIRVPLEAMPKIDGDVMHEDLLLVNTVRTHDKASLYSNVENSNAKIPFSALWRREYGNHLLAAALQTASPGNVLNTAYAHTWTPHTTQPDFSANAGYFYSCAVTGAISGKDEVAKSAIISDLAIVITPPAKGKANLVMLEGNFWSPFGKTVGQTFEATPSTPSTNFMPGSKFNVTVDGGSGLPVRSARILINSNPFKVPSGGTAATIGHAIPFWDLKLSLQLYYNTDTDDFVSDMMAGTSKSLVLTNGVATSAYEAFAATMANARLINDPLEDSEGNAIVNCEFQLESTGGSGALSIVSTDDVSTF